MGENSPWLTIIEGSDSGRPSRSTLFSCRSSMASIRQLGLPGTRSLASLFRRTMPPVWHSRVLASALPWRASRIYRHRRVAPLNAFRLLYQHFRTTNVPVVGVRQNRKSAQKEPTGTTGATSLSRAVRLCRSLVSTSPVCPERTQNFGTPLTSSDQRRRRRRTFVSWVETCLRTLELWWLLLSF